MEIYKEIFPENVFPMLPSTVMHVTDETLYLGDTALQRTNTSIYNDQNLLILRDQLSTLRSLAQCVKMNWMSILVSINEHKLDYKYQREPSLILKVQSVKFVPFKVVSF